MFHKSFLIQIITIAITTSLFFTSAVPVYAKTLTYQPVAKVTKSFVISDSDEKIEDTQKKLEVKLEKEREEYRKKLKEASLKDGEEDYIYASFKYKDGYYIATKSQFLEFEQYIKDFGVVEEFFEPAQIEITPATTKRIIKDPRDVMWNNNVQAEFDEWVETVWEESPTWFEEVLSKGYADWEIFLSYHYGYNLETKEMEDGSNIEIIDVPAVYKTKTNYFKVDVRYDFDSVSEKHENFIVDGDYQKDFEETLNEFTYIDSLEDLNLRNSNLYQKNSVCIEASFHFDNTTLRWNKNKKDAAKVITALKADAITDRAIENLNLDNEFVVNQYGKNGEEEVLRSITLIRITYSKNNHDVEEVFALPTESFLIHLSDLGKNNEKISNEIITDFFDTAVG